jgi:hypothetical protein
VIEVEYLAFYQTAAFGNEHRWQIEFMAEMRGHELVTRGELLRDEPDHPRAHEEYFKIALGPLLKLPKSIKAGKWRRLTFLFTTGEKMKAAEMVQDLVLDESDRKILWRTLRDRALSGGRYRASDLPEIDLDPALLAMLVGADKFYNSPDEDQA